MERQRNEAILTLSRNQDYPEVKMPSHLCKSSDMLSRNQDY